MNINIKPVNMILEDDIYEYVDKKLKHLERFITIFGDDIFIQVEVGKTTNHHRLGNIFRAEINVSVSGKVFRAVSEKEDLKSAIDDVEKELQQELVSYKDKQKTLFKKGAIKVKEFLKGLRKK